MPMHRRGRQFIRGKQRKQGTSARCVLLAMKRPCGGAMGLALFSGYEQWSHGRQTGVGGLTLPRGGRQRWLAGHKGCMAHPRSGVNQSGQGGVGREWVGGWVGGGGADTTQQSNAYCTRSNGDATIESEDGHWRAGRGGEGEEGRGESAEMPHTAPATTAQHEKLLQWLVRG
jgi:hypothetical protein